MIKGTIVTEVKSSEKYFLGVSMLNGPEKPVLVAKLGNALVSHLELVLRTQKINDYGVMKRS